MNLGIQILFLGLLFFGFFAVISQPREKSIIAFIIVWFVFPNHTTVIVDLNGLPLFFVVEIFLVLALWAVVFMYRGDRYSFIGFRHEKFVLKILALTFLVQYSVGILMVDITTNVSSQELTNKRLEGMVHGLAAISYCFACYKFVRTRHHIFLILRTFLALSSILSLELLVSIFGPMSSAISQYTMRPVGGFFSIFLGDYHAVGLFSAVGILSGLYLARTFRKSKYYFAALISIFPLIYNFGERATLLAFFFGFAYLVIMNISVVKRRIAVSIAAALLVFGALFFQSLQNAVEGYAQNFAGDLVDNKGLGKQIVGIASSDSMSVRLGMQVRGLEIIWESLPFGVGEDAVDFYLQKRSNSTHQNFLGITNGKIVDSYNIVANGFKRTELHNSYLDIIASYGLLGMISLILVIKALVSNWRQYLRKSSYYDDDNVGGIIFSLLIFCGIFYFFYSSPRIYVIFFTLFHITYLLSHDPKLFFKDQLTH